MNQGSQSSSSPFSALTYQEQQDRWLEWRSRQLNYQPAEETPVPRPVSYEKPVPPAAPVRPAPPLRRRELDQVLSKHKNALRQAGQFQTTAIG